MKRQIIILTLQLFIAGHGISQIPSEGLAGYWPFNGDANDQSGNNHNGTVYGATLTEDRFGNPNSAYYFDGVDDRIFIGNNLIIEGKSLTMSCWYKSDKSGIIISSGNRNSYILMKAHPDSLHGGFYLSDATDGHGSNTGYFHVDTLEWHHVAMTYDGTNHNLYLNGKKVSSQLADGDVFSNQSVYVNFGVYQYFGSNFQGWFKGTMDEVRFYNTVLTPDEIEKMYTDGLCYETVYETVYDTVTIYVNDTMDLQDGLVAWYPFNNSANDESKNGINGIINGATPTYDRFGNENSAYEFDGDDWIEVPHNPAIDFSLTDSYSLSVWAKISPDHSFGSVLEKWVSGFNAFPYEIRIGKSETEPLNINTGRYIGGLPQDSTRCQGSTFYDESRSLDMEKYHHIVSVFEPDKISLYINGNLADISYNYMNSGDVSNTHNLFIGRRGGSTDRFFKGSIDDLRIYEKPLTEAEVSVLFNGGGNIKIINDTLKIYDTIYVELPGSGSYSELPAENLVSHYPFNGNANDLGSSKADGIVNGATLTSDRHGLENSAYYFDGVDDHIIIPDSLRILDEFTISFWALNEKTEGYANILSDGSSFAGGNDFLINFRNNSIGIRADKLGKPLNYEDYAPSELSGLDINNKWVHVTWAMNPGYSKIYLDGKEIAHINIAGTNMGYHDANSYIGARHVWGSPDYFFQGKLDDIRIYNTELDSMQIKTLYNGGVHTVTVYDTITTQLYDTTFVTVHDTLYTEIIDTTYITSHETVYTTVTDTIFVTKTVYDTVEVAKNTAVMDTLIIDAVLTDIVAPWNINRIKVYPNPARDHLNISIENYSLMHKYRLKIINQMGSTVYETQVRDPLYEIDLSSWTGPGLYFLQIIDYRKNIIDIRKIIIR